MNDTVQVVSMCCAACVQGFLTLHISGCIVMHMNGTAQSLEAVESEEAECGELLCRAPCCANPVSEEGVLCSACSAEIHGDES